MDNEQGQVKTASENTSTRSAALEFFLSDEAVSSQQESASDIIRRAERREDSAIEAAGAARDAGQIRIENDAFFQQSDFLRQAGATRQSLRESRGIATSATQFQVFDESVNAQLRDIQRVKQEALAVNDANYYQQVAQVELETIQMRQSATQQAFSNILSLAGLGQQQQTFELQQRAQNFTERQAIGNIALQFGLNAEPGDTIESIITKAAPLATEQRKLELDQMRATINQANASANQIRAAVRRQEKVSNMTPEEMRDAVALGTISATDAFNAAETSEQRQAVLGVQRGIANVAAAEVVSELVGTGETRQNIIDTVLASNPGLLDVEVASMVDAALSKQQTQPFVSVVDVLGEVPNVINDFGVDVNRIIFGENTNIRNPNPVPPFNTGIGQFLQ